MKKVMITLFLLSIFCWISSFALYVILRIDLFKTIFIVSNITMIFLGAWVSGYYFRKYEHSTKSGDAHSLDALKYAKNVCKKCVNCKYYASKRLNPTGKVYKCNYCDYYEGNIVRNVNLFTSCKRFEAKEKK